MNTMFYLPKKLQTSIAQVGSGTLHAVKCHHFFLLIQFYFYSNINKTQFLCYLFLKGLVIEFDPVRKTKTMKKKH